MKKFMNNFYVKIGEKALYCRMVTAIITSFSGIIAMQQPSQVNNVFSAARNADINNLRFWIDKGTSVESPSRDTGITLLGWVVIPSADKAPEQQLAAAQFLVQRGARINALDTQGMSILHHAVRSGNIPLISYLLKNDAKSQINLRGGTERRSPMAEALRAHKAGTLYLDDSIVNTLNSAIDFNKRVPELLQKVAEKNKRKLSQEKVIAVLNLLRTFGADPNMKDKSGNDIEHYINKVILAAKPEREALKQAAYGIIQPELPRRQSYITDLPKAVEMLRQLKNQMPAGTPASVLTVKAIDRVIWAIEAARAAQEPAQSADLLRIALALLTKVNEAGQGALATEQIQLILHDVALKYIEEANKPAEEPLRPAEPKKAPEQPKAQEKAKAAEQPRAAEKPTAQKPPEPVHAKKMPESQNLNPDSVRYIEAAKEKLGKAVGIYELLFDQSMKKITDKDVYQKLGFDITPKTTELTAKFGKEWTEVRKELLKLVHPDKMMAISLNGESDKQKQIRVEKANDLVYVVNFWK